jgi:hypothetical protein
VVDPLRLRPAASPRGDCLRRVLDLGRLFLLLSEPADEVGDVRDLLLEVFLVLLEVAEPLLSVRNAAAAKTPAAAMSPVSMATMHLHLPSPCS